MIHIDTRPILAALLASFWALTYIHSGWLGLAAMAAVGLAGEVVLYRAARLTSVGDTRE